MSVSSSSLTMYPLLLFSLQSASVGGAAHLVNFQGTDTIASLVMARDYYGSSKIAGLSIPAAEHSTITSWTKDGETDAFRNMLTKVSHTDDDYCTICMYMYIYVIRKRFYALLNNSQ